MVTQIKSQIVLDVSNGLGYGLLYHSVIGKAIPPRYPFIARKRFRFSYKIKKLV